MVNPELANDRSKASELESELYALQRESEELKAVFAKEGLDFSNTEDGINSVMAQLMMLMDILKDEGYDDSGVTAPQVEQNFELLREYLELLRNHPQLRRQESQFNSGDKEKAGFTQSEHVAAFTQQHRNRQQTE